MAEGKAKKTYRKFTRAEKSAWAKEQREVKANDHAAALKLRAEMADAIAAFPIKKLPPIPPRSKQVKLAPHHNGRKAIR